MDLQAYFSYLASFLAGTAGSFLLIDLIAAATNALNGAILAQRPDYYKGRQWSVVGILLLAIFGGIGGGVSRDVLLNKVPGALSNPWYLILCVLAGVVAMFISYKGGQKFRESFYQFMTAFSLPWYAAIGVQAALNAGLPDIAALWFAWEEPLPRGVPEHVRGEIVPRESLKEKMQPDWEPKYD